MSGSYECGCHLSGWNARVWFYLEYRFPGVDHVALRDHGNRRQLLSLCPHTESVVLWRKRSRSFDLWCLLRSWCSKSFLGTMWGCHDNPQPCNWISGPWHWINHDQCMCRRIFHDFLRSLLLVFLVLLGCFFWYGLCVLSSKGRRMSYSLLWAPCSQVVTFRSISARWSPASVCSFGCYGFFPLCLAPENLVIVTVALTGLPAV